MDDQGLKKYARRIIKRKFQVQWNIPVEVVDDDTPPTLIGRLGYYINGKGKRLKHRSARATWIPSTRRIVVGREWSRSGEG